MPRPQGQGEHSERADRLRVSGYVHGHREGGICSGTPPSRLHGTRRRLRLLSLHFRTRRAGLRRSHIMHSYPAPSLGTVGNNGPNGLCVVFDSKTRVSFKLIDDAVVI